MTDNPTTSGCPAGSPTGRQLALWRHAKADALRTEVIAPGDGRAPHVIDARDLCQSSWFARSRPFESRRSQSAAHDSVSANRSREQRRTQGLSCAWRRRSRARGRAYPQRRREGTRSALQNSGTGSLRGQSGYALTPCYRAVDESVKSDPNRPIRAGTVSSEHNARQRESWKADALPTELLPPVLLPAAPAPGLPDNATTRDGEREGGPSRGFD